YSHALGYHARMRRNAIVRQTIPRRKFHDFDIAAEECQRARQSRHALAVPANDGERYCRRVLARRNRPREIGEHESFGAVRDLCQDKGLPGLQQRCRCLTARTHAFSLRWKSRKRRKSALSNSCGVISIPLTQAKICCSGTSSQRSSSSSSTSLSDASCASANLPSTRSISRMPRCQQRKRGRRRRGSSPSRDRFVRVVTAYLQRENPGGGRAWFI